MLFVSYYYMFISRDNLDILRQSWIFLSAWSFGCCAWHRRNINVWRWWWFRMRKRRFFCCTMWMCLSCLFLSLRVCVIFSFLIFFSIFTFIRSLCWLCHDVSIRLTCMEFVAYIIAFASIFQFYYVRTIWNTCIIMFGIYVKMIMNGDDGFIVMATNTIPSTPHREMHPPKVEAL